MNGQTIRDVAVEESEVDQSYPETVPVFMEADYLAAHPDVAEKVAKGEIASGQVHYEQFGKKEGRRLHAISERANIDALLCSPSGSLFVIGWAEESASPLRLIRVATSQATLEIPAGGLVRFRRPDVENVLSFNGAAHFGLCGLAQVKLSRRVPFKPSAVTLEYENGSSVVFCPSFRTVEDPQLLEIVLGYLSNSAFCGNPQVELMFALDGGFGEEVIALSKRINAGLLRSAKSVWQNNVSTEPRASIIVCLYGKPEFMFLQSSSFFRSFSASEYEFIYVCNSPELLETLVKTAAACEVVYDMRLTVVGLSGNVGFGGANNAASRYANSGRLLFLNPDVFPCEPSWLQKHETVLRGLPEEQTRLFGSRLFYADGSLMHAGMYFEMEPGISLNQNELRSRELVRVEHYGKGAPPTARRFCGSARVPAVSGAFISMDRGLFERLNGFSDEVIYGHYEDADLCLRAMKTGAAAWVHDVPMWHLEGKGSTRLPHHDGASLVNRWSFAQRWGTLLRSGWLGPEPAAFALEANANRQLGAGAGMRPLATAAE